MERTKDIKQKDNIIKRWWNLTNPSKKYFAGQIIYFCIYTVLLSVITIFAARTINCMYAKDWEGAFINLALEITTIVLRNVSIHIQYKYYCLSYGHIRHNVAKKIYNKFLSCNNQEFNAVSKEKVTNIALNNMSYLGEFPDSIASFIAYSLQVIFTLVTVYVSNALAGLIVTALGVVNFFAYYFFNKKLGKIMLERYEKKDDMFTTYSKVIDGKAVINELNSKDKYEAELIKNVDDFSNAYSKYYKVYSLKQNIYYAFWNIIIYCITAFLLFSVSKGTLDMSIYLIIVPYLTTCTDKLNTLFDKTSNLENMRVDVDRVSLILNLNDEELIQYGDLNKQSECYSLGLIHVTEYEKEGQKYTLKDVNMTFKTGKINIVKGNKENGKRVIFDLLRRYNMPDKGKILLDNLNLYDYNEKTFKSHINYCSSHPIFVSGTIKENLSLANGDMQAIEKLCAEVGILNDIQGLSKGFDSHIAEVNSSATYFMLGLVRALLSDCKILMIYELPQDAPDTFRQHIVNLLTTHKIDKTVILFTHSDVYDDIGECVYEVVKGSVSKIK